MSAETQLNWPNFAVLMLSPAVAVVGIFFYVAEQGLRVSDILCFWTMLLLTGLAITAGYHRYYCHRSYECHPIVQGFYLLFGAAALQAPVLSWVSEHRDHHRFVDQEGDPYNIKKGFFWAHMGWTYHGTITRRGFGRISDLKSRMLLRVQERYYVPLGVLVGFGLPLLMGLAADRPWGGVLWGGVVRLVVAHHSTFLVNSVGHFFGRQPFSDQNSSRDSTLLALLTLGEGYHNFHHTFPGDYRNGVRWYHWDPTKWWIYGLEAVGLSWRLRRTSIERVDGVAAKRRLHDQTPAGRAVVLRRADR